MKNPMSNFRKVLVTLAAVSTIAPQVVLAKGPGGGGGASHSASHASSGSSFSTLSSARTVKINSAMATSQVKTQTIDTHVIETAGNGTTGGPLNPYGPLNASATTLSGASSYAATKAQANATQIPSTSNAGSSSDSNSTHTPSSNTPASTSSTGSTSTSTSKVSKSSTSGGSSSSWMDAASDSSSTSDAAVSSPAAETTTTNTGTLAAVTSSTAMQSDGADLVLEDVVLSAPANLAAGPQYTVKFRNQGTAAAGKFVVGVFAGFSAKLSDDAPRAVVEVNCLAAGESKAVTLRLPQKSLQMAGADGEQAAFTRLFVGVDVMNTVAETDETNNMAVIDRAALDAAQ